MGIAYYFDTGDTRYRRSNTFSISASALSITVFTTTACHGALMHSVAITASGLPTTTASHTFALQGSLDNTNWFTAANTTINSNTTIFLSATDAYSYIRNAITANTAGGSLIIENLGAK